MSTNLAPLEILILLYFFLKAVLLSQSSFPYEWADGLRMAAAMSCWVGRRSSSK